MQRQTSIVSDPGNLQDLGHQTSEKPKTYRIPAKGGNPYFGLTRSWYYSAEKDGLIRLVRLRKRGRLRGVTLVPYDDVAAIISAAKLG